MAPVAKANVYKVNTNLHTLRTQTRTDYIHECGGYWIELANTKLKKMIIVNSKIERRQSLKFEESKNKEKRHVRPEHGVAMKWLVRPCKNKFARGDRRRSWRVMIRESRENQKTQRISRPWEHQDKRETSTKPTTKQKRPGRYRAKQQQRSR